jgi:hypothetical protein
VLRERIMLFPSNELMIDYNQNCSPRIKLHFQAFNVDLEVKHLNCFSSDTLKTIKNSGIRRFVLILCYEEG